MKLTPEQQAVLDGSKGEVMAKVMKTLVMYGDAFGAEKMVPVTSTYGHTVISFGINAMKPVYDLYDQLIEAGAFSEQKFTADPLPLDKNVPRTRCRTWCSTSSCISSRRATRAQLKKARHPQRQGLHLHLLPRRGGQQAQAGRGALVGGVVRRGVRQQRARRALQPQLRHDRAHGLHRGLRAVFRLPDRRRTQGRLDRRGAHNEKARAAAARLRHRHEGHGKGAVCQGGSTSGLARRSMRTPSRISRTSARPPRPTAPCSLYHIEHLTPEAVQQGEALIRDGAPVYVIDDAELQRVRESYPCVWKNLNAKPKLCFMGCPHMTLHQLIDTTERVEASLKAHGQRKVCIPTVFTAAPGVIEEFERRSTHPACATPASCSATSARSCT